MVLEINDVTKLYSNKRGIMDVSLSVDEGQIFGLLGPNGSGKTTLMKTITGLQRIQRGSIKVLGYDVATEISKAIEKVGSLIEAPASINYMSAYDNLKNVSRFYKDPLDPLDVLDMVKLTKYKKEKVSRFSLGMRQRMGLALAIVGNPKLLILDEPTNGVDIEGTVEIRNIIKEMVEKNRCTVLISSHLAAELQQICTHVGTMQESRLISKDSMEYVLENYPSLEDYFIQTVRREREEVLS